MTDVSKHFSETAQERSEANDVQIIASQVFSSKVVKIMPQEHPVVITKFVENAKEIEMDAVAQNGEVKTLQKIDKQKITEVLSTAGNKTMTTATTTTTTTAAPATITAR